MKQRHNSGSGKIEKQNDSWKIWEVDENPNSLKNKICVCDEGSLEPEPPCNPSILRQTQPPLPHQTDHRSLSLDLLPLKYPAERHEEVSK